MPQRPGISNSHTGDTIAASVGVLITSGDESRRGNRLGQLRTSCCLPDDGTNSGIELLTQTGMLLR